MSTVHKACESAANSALFAHLKMTGKARYGSGRPDSSRNVPQRTSRETVPRLPNVPKRRDLSKWKQIEKLYYAAPECEPVTSDCDDGRSIGINTN